MRAYVYVYECVLVDIDGGGVYLRINHAICLICGAQWTSEVAYTRKMIVNT